MAIITISDDTHTLGEEIASKASQRLGFVLVDSNLVNDDLVSKGLRNKEAFYHEILKKKTPSLYIKKFIVEKALNHNVIILNLGGELLFHNLPGTVHVKLYEINDNTDIKSLIASKRVDYKRFIKSVFGKERSVGSNFDLQLKIENHDSDYIVDMIQRAVELKGIALKAGVTWKALQKLRSIINSSEITHNRGLRSVGIPSFAHPSEKEFARVLDFYRIKWEYEPRSFLLKSDEEGKVKEEFTPDFYLPEFDLYIELTTLKQKLVTKKNRKLRRLKELYPNLNIKLFYGKDYKKFLQRFGIK